eukprot:CAMPEP_0172460572 /NCGR_PEP_ID=MMETSP1065-20121228/37391_1 /TAXON_ID=265537 /ORGANISM="Amphiprora paludosa, Strain CCMP125" /LENGTH=296 /DNA_ID=CAMNT_0013215633 /DNA_START=184 /DNA_END=1071 /DNA_ORIENTATION=+
MFRRIVQSRKFKKEQKKKAAEDAKKKKSPPTPAAVAVKTEQEAEQKAAAKQKESSPKESVDHKDDGSSDEDDPDAKLKSINNLKGGGGTDLRGSLNRYDEMTSYTNRSERSHKVPDSTPSQDEVQKRAVRVHEEVTIVDHVGEAMTEQEVQSYYMQEADFRRCDADVELTSFRWEKARKGRSQFDEEENTLRGLEDVIGADPKRESLRIRHVQDVLTETMKQRAHGKEILDWEKIRHVAEKTSKQSTKTAHEIAQQDELDAKGSGGLRSSQRFRNMSISRKSGDNNRKSLGKMRLL